MKIVKTALILNLRMESTIITVLFIELPLSQAEINQLKVVRPNNEKETLGGNTYI